jgi:DNA repair exonuclease SbcCD ATPase subunit
MTGLKDKTVEELRDGWLDKSGNTWWRAIWPDVFDEMNRRLEESQRRYTELFNEFQPICTNTAHDAEEAQQKIVAQQARIEELLDALSVWEGYISTDLEGDDLSALAALKAEVAAKALEEVIAEIKTASEERFKFLEECRQEAEKCKEEGDWYGWNFHVGRAAGANEADLFYYRRVRKIEAKVSEYRAKAGRK